MTFTAWIITYSDIPHSPSIAGPTAPNSPPSAARRVRTDQTSGRSRTKYVRAGERRKIIIIHPIETGWNFQRIRTQPKVQGARCLLPKDSSKFISFALAWRASSNPLSSQPTPQKSSSPDRPDVEPGSNETDDHHIHTFVR